MRKRQWDCIVEIIDSFSIIHNEIDSFAKKGDKESALSLLLSCQENAIELGNSIEESEGEGFISVKYLEEYCEEIFKKYNEVYENRICENECLCCSLEESIKRVFDSVQKDIIVKKEAVFLPYKASMWDSLESIWKKYNEDPCWNAKVIPIPYFDRTPEGGLGEEHYEGNDFPEYVPITSWREYNLEKNHPEEIFIINPYDEHNLVTSVHPFFYSKNIHKFTDCLIYVPYFVLSEPNVNSETSLKEIEHFVLTPGVIEADRVIVQSENMREAYVSILVKKIGENTRSIWEKKIEGTGSPKFDKLLSTKKEDLFLPEDWQRIISSSSGKTKKVVLYNTSIAALLENTDKMIAKIERVLETFKKNSDDVVLWWRPHPLIEATLKSMRSDLLEAFINVRDKYIEEGYGIYDDTPDLDRAIVYTDAYYGDWSSLVELYKKTGKAIMIQNVDC